MTHLGPGVHSILFAWLSDWQQAMYQDLLNKSLSDSNGKQVRMCVA